MFVKIAVLGRPAVSAVASNGASVRAILSAEAVSFGDRDTITIDGVAANLSSSVRERNDERPTVITLTPEVKGGRL